MLAAQNFRSFLQTLAANATWKRTSIKRGVCNADPETRRQTATRMAFLRPATTQNLVVKFDGEIRSGVLVENAPDDFPKEKKLENLLPNFAEVRHQFRQKLRQLHSGNRWCLHFGLPTRGNVA